MTAGFCVRYKFSISGCCFYSECFLVSDTKQCLIETTKKLILQINKKVYFIINFPIKIVILTCVIY